MDHQRLRRCLFLRCHDLVSRSRFVNIVALNFRTSRLGIFNGRKEYASSSSPAMRRERDKIGKHRACVSRRIGTRRRGDAEQVPDCEKAAGFKKRAPARRQCLRPSASLRLRVNNFPGQPKVLVQLPQRACNLLSFPMKRSLIGIAAAPCCGSQRVAVHSTFARGSVYAVRSRTRRVTAALHTVRCGVRPRPSCDA
jgi:hypothetical protein